MNHSTGRNMKWIEGNNIHLLAPPLKKENVAKVYFMLHYQFILLIKMITIAPSTLAKIFLVLCGWRIITESGTSGATSSTSRKGKMIFHNECNKATTIKIGLLADSWGQVEVPKYWTSWRECHSSLKWNSPAASTTK